MVFSIWDLGGARDTRSFWRFYYEDSHAVIFVVDSSDEARMDEAREDLHRLLTEHELWDAPLLVMANKQDVASALSLRRITELLQLFSLSSRNWYIVDTQALHPDSSETNLHAGLDWRDLPGISLDPLVPRINFARDDVHGGQGCRERFDEYPPVEDLVKKIAKHAYKLIQIDSYK